MLTALAVVHWNERRLPEQRADRQPAERCLGLLQELALSMHHNERGRLVRIPTSSAAEELALEFQHVPTSSGFPAALEFLEQESSDSGIIVRRGGDLQFWHLTFQEYLAARTIAGVLNLHKTSFCSGKARSTKRNGEKSFCCSSASFRLNRQRQSRRSYKDASRYSRPLSHSRAESTLRWFDRGHAYPRDRGSSQRKSNL